VEFVNVQAEENILKMIVQWQDTVLLSTLNEEWLTGQRNNLLQVLRTKEECLDFFYCTQWVEDNNIDVAYPLIFDIFKNTEIDGTKQSTLLILEEKYLRRKIMDVGNYIVDNVKKLHPLTVAPLAEERLRELKYVGKEVEKLGDTFEPDTMDLIDCGIDEMESLCLSRQEIMILGGERGHHKTNFALHICASAVEKNVIKLKDESFKVLFLSREMPFKVVKARLISKLFRIPFGDVRRGNYNIKEVHKIFMEKYWYYHENFIVVPPESLRDVEDIAKVILTHKPTIWVLDYMQLLARGIAGKDGDPNSVIAWLATRLKSLAQMTNTLGIAVSTLKKFENQRITHIPRLEDLYSSVEIQYLASWIGLCYWSWFYNRNLNKKPFFVLWEKNRNDEPFTMPIGVEPEFSSFAPIPKGQIKLEDYLK